MFTRLTYVKLLRNRAIGLLWIGQVTSTIGDRLYAMAVLWLVMQLTASPKAMALVTLAASLPAALLGLLAGAVLDRVDRLRTLLWIDWVRAALTGLLPVVHHLIGLTPLALALAGALLGGLGSFFDPGLQAAVTDLVQPEHLGAINGLLDTTRRLGSTLGPALAPLLLTALPMIHFFTVDALTFVVSALSLLYIVRRRQVPPPTPAVRRSVLQDALAGLRTAFGEPFLRWGLVVRGLCNLLWPAFTIGVPLLVNRALHGDTGLYGIVLALYTAGALLANVVLGNLQLPSSLPLFCLAWVWIGVGFAGLGLAPAPAWALPAAVWTGLTSPVVHMTLDSYAARVLPRHERARYFSLQQVVLMSASGLGLPAMGLLMTAVGPRWGLGLAGGGIVLIGFAGLLATWLPGTSVRRNEAHGPQRDSCT